MTEKLQNNKSNSQSKLTQTKNETSNNLGKILDTNTKVNEFLKNSKYGNEFLKKMKNYGYPMNFKFEESIISRNSLKGDISIGLHTSLQKYDPLVPWGFDRLSYEHMIAYKILHEIAHTLHESVPQNKWTVLSYMSDLRLDSEGEKGITALGGMGVYKNGGIGVQLQEDAVELVAMFLVDPAIVVKYLKYISSGSKEANEYCTRMNISIVNRKLAYTIFESVYRSLETIGLELPNTKTLRNSN